MGNIDEGSSKRKFEHPFAHLSERDRRSVGADKVLLFLRSVNKKGRMTILFELEDDNRVNGLTEDWTEVKRVCPQHEEKRSAGTRPTRGGERRMVSDYASPPTEESSSRNGSVELDIEALVREAYEILKTKVEAEEGSIMESGWRESKDVEEDVSLRTKGGAYVEAEGAYNGDMGEGVECWPSSTTKRTKGGADKPDGKGRKEAWDRSA